MQVNQDETLNENYRDLVNHFNKKIEELKSTMIGKLILY